MRFSAEAPALPAPQDRDGGLSGGLHCTQEDILGLGNSQASYRLFVTLPDFLHLQSQRPIHILLLNLWTVLIRHDHFYGFKG